MEPAPRDHAQVTVARYEAERRDRRGRLALVAACGGAVLLVSSLLAWVNHPRIGWNSDPIPALVLKEYSHSIGATTAPAGVAVLAAGAAVVWLAWGFRRGSVAAGWAALAAGALAAGMCAWESVNLMLTRRNYLDHQPPFIANHSSIIYAVGIGVWLAGLASVVTIAVAGIHLRDEYRTWRHEHARVA